MTSLIFSQEQKDFQKVIQYYVNGDATIIGNNIVSKNDRKAFNDFSLINDQIKMMYVDIDKDASTFSSSSATLDIPYNNLKIKRAILYWSGVYPYDRGVKKERPEEIYYEGNDTRQRDFNTIKFKTPNASYKSITGSIIFDGFGKDNYIQSAPYICFADVTSDFQGPSVNGEYTVANIRATQGYVSGGSAAGWFLFIVYETEEKPTKYITAYHGFTGLNDNTVEFNFDGFKTKSKGAVDASIYVATLEGDGKLSRDQCEIKRPSDGVFIPLKNSLRSPKNFFNSKISINNSFFTNRKPNSANTLGFDLLQMKIPRSALSNNQSETTLRFGTRADRYYLYFTAFSVELNNEFEYLESEDVVADQNIEVEAPVTETVVTTSQTVEAQEAQKAQAVQEAQLAQEAKEAQKAQAAKEEKEAQLVQEAMNVETNPIEETPISKKEENNLTAQQMEAELKKVDLNIPSLKKGYYIITNVFSKISNAETWEEFLQQKGYETTVFMNPKNRWHYVSVFNDDNLNEVYKKHRQLLKLEFFKDIWVYKINMK